jgi:hypothetical protein
MRSSRCVAQLPLAYQLQSRYNKDIMFAREYAHPYQQLLSIKQNCLQTSCAAVL